MKRDLNLCRDYLLDMAGEKEAEYDSPNKVHLYHIGLLHNSGLIDIDNNYSLTMKGHDILDLIRDDDTWDYIMSVSDSVGGLPFGMILEYAQESLTKKVDKVVKNKQTTETQNLNNSLSSFQPYIDAVNKINKLFGEMNIELDDWKHDDDSGFVKKDLVFTPELDKRFSKDNVPLGVSDAYLLAKDGRYQEALLRLNLYIRNGFFSRDTIELDDYFADEVKLLLDHILDNLPFN